MAYKVIGKIQVEDKYTKDPVNNGMVAQKIGLDLKIYKEGVELDNEGVIREKLAYRARLGFRSKATGAEVILFEGKGASDARYPEVGGPEDGRHAGRYIPLPGYTETDAGIEAALDSNGLRIFPNFKHQDPGCYEAFATVEGLGDAAFPDGDTVCFGAKSARDDKHGG